MFKKYAQRKFMLKFLSTIGPRFAFFNTHELFFQLRDPSYKWNEWDLRAEALQLSDLRKKKTRSAQTDVRCNHREAETQVQIPFWSMPNVKSFWRKLVIQKLWICGDLLFLKNNI